MTDHRLLGPWVRRFLLEYLVTERNLARNTQQSYRDTLCLLIPFLALHAKKEVHEISVIDVSADAVRLFLQHLEEHRKCNHVSRKARDGCLLSAPDQATDQGRRDHGLLLFLYNTGARADEAAQATIADLTLAQTPRDHSLVQVHGKGNKLRRCSLWPQGVLMSTPPCDVRKSSKSKSSKS